MSAFGKWVSQVMEDAGKSLADGLGITLCLVDMLPTIPLQLAFNTATARLLGCTPEVYAAQPKMRTDGLDFSHAPPPGSDRDAMAVLRKEILKSMCGTEEKAIQPTWLLTVASVGSVVSRRWRMKVVIIPTIHACLFPQLDAPH